MGNTVRIRNGMENATEGDILGSASDIIKDLGVVDLAGGHLLVTQNSPLGMSVQVAGGVVYVPNSSYSILDSDTPKFYPVVCSNEVLAVTDNVSGSTRYDIVCVKIDKVIVPDPDASNVATKVVIKGTPGAGVPATPANHYKLAEIKVVNGETEITNAEITDKRTQVHLNSILIPGLPTGAIVGTTDTQTLTNKTLTAPALSSPTISGAWDGWISAGETWTYASADDPTFTFTVAADVTTKYSAGMKIKLTQGTVKYFIITAVSTYSGGKTTITVYGGTDYDLANSAISANAYSMMRTPQGFPMSPAKWTQTYSDSGSNRSQSSPTNDAWYNINAAQLSVPIGVWRVGYRVIAGGNCSSATTYIQIFTTLSTGNNNASDTDFSCFFGGDYASANLSAIDYREVEKVLALTSKTTYYLNTRIFAGGTISSIANNGLHRPITIYAECAYL